VDLAEVCWFLEYGKREARKSRRALREDISKTRTSWSRSLLTYHHRPQDAGRVRPLPHREPGGPSGRGAEAGRARFSHNPGHSRAGETAYREAEGSSGAGLGRTISGRGGVLLSRGSGVRFPPGAPFVDRRLHRVGASGFHCAVPPRGWCYRRRGRERPPGRDKGRGRLKDEPVRIPG
jgi:hypothetical protein